MTEARNMKKIEAKKTRVRRAITYKQLIPAECNEGEREARNTGISVFYVRGQAERRVMPYVAAI